MCNVIIIIILRLIFIAFKISDAYFFKFKKPKKNQRIIRKKFKKIQNKNSK